MTKKRAKKRKWTAVPVGDFDESFGLVDEYGGYFAKVFSGKGKDVAQLMAAAPELLAALVKCLSSGVCCPLCFGYECYPNCQGDKAVRKATGKVSK